MTSFFKTIHSSLTRAHPPTCVQASATDLMLQTLRDVVLIHYSDVLPLSLCCYITTKCKACPVINFKLFSRGAQRRRRAGRRRRRRKSWQLIHIVGINTHTQKTKIYLYMKQRNENWCILTVEASVIVSIKLDMTNITKRLFSRNRCVLAALSFAKLVQLEY